MYLKLIGKTDVAAAIPTEEARELMLRQLMVRVARKDETALAELYRMTSRGICAFALRRMSDPAAADEIVTETLYEVWRHGHRFAGQSRVTTWILGIARHKILDRLRQRGRHEHESLGDEAETVADESPDAFRRLADLQDARQIALCLEALPAEQRECIHLVFYDDLPLADVAQIQNCPTNTVKTRLFHARRKIKACLERQIEWLGRT
jgi:RNA polymerase sigma-70 factor (ECF subfamily)